MRTRTEQKYDIFISYRRKGGEDEAWKLKLFLEQMGYRVFMDREALRSGDFNEQLYQRIDQCRDFLLICSPDALVRCRNPEDWVCKEITRALQGGKNIIPIWVNGFDEAELKLLPEELTGLSRLQSVTPQNATYEESVRKLCTYLQARPVKKYWQRLILTFSALAILTALILCGLFFFQNQGTGFPSGKKEKEQIEALSAAASAQLGYLNGNLVQLNQVLTACDYYVSGYKSDGDARLACVNGKKFMQSWAPAYSVPTENAAQYPYYEHLEKLTAAAQRTAEYADYIDYLDTVIFQTNLGNDQKKEVLKQFSIIAEQDGELAVARTFLLFLPVTEPETTLAELLDMAKYWQALPGFGKSWIGGSSKEAELKRKAENAETARNNALIAIQSASGVSFQDFNVSIIP